MKGAYNVCFQYLMSARKSSDSIKIHSFPSENGDNSGYSGDLQCRDEKCRRKKEREEVFI